MKRIYKNIFVFMISWILIGLIGAKIWYQVYDISGWHWFQGIKLLPLGLIVWYGFDKIIQKTKANRISSNLLAFLAALILYWPVLQLGLAIIYWRNL